MLRRTLPLLAVCLLSTGCLCKFIMGTQADEKDLAKQYFTWAGLAPFADKTQGLVVGRVSLGGHGAMLRINGEKGPIEHTLEFRTRHDRGLILGVGYSEISKKTIEIYAGNIPGARKDVLSEIVGVGSLTGALFMGDGGSVSMNSKALETQLPTGWFFVRLPPGHYQLADLEWEQTESNTNSGAYTSTTTITTRSFNVSSGPSFDVKPGVVNYVGETSWATEGSAAEITWNDDAAREATRLAVRRLEKNTPMWEIVRAGAQ